MRGGIGHTRASLPSLWIALTLACLNGLLYLFTVPPWQHYDEPNHFEVAWLIAHRSQLPKPDDFDQDMRRDVATSMIAHGFYRGGSPPDLLQSEPINIGIPQIDDYLAYYALAALPLRALASADITQQLYAARAVSLLLFLISILGCWGILCELTGPASALRWLVPVCLALLPAYADIMTAVNNDVAAIAFGTLLTWGIVRLIQRGFSFRWLIWSVAWALACAWSRSTTFPVIAALPLALSLSLLKQRGRALVWLAFVIIMAVVFVQTTQWDDARGWLRLGEQPGGMQRASTLARSGQYVFELNPAVGTGSQIEQAVAADVVENLRGQTVTLGAWVWGESAQPQPGRTPILILNDITEPGLYQEIQITQQPTFYSFTATLPVDTRQLWVGLVQPQNTGLGPIFYDDVVLTHDNVLTGTNLIQNPSAEYGMARLKERWQALIGPELKADPTFFLGILGDRNLLGVYVGKIMNLSLQTFWVRFGWGHVSLQNKALNPLLNAVLIASILCSAYGWALKLREGKRWHANTHAVAVLSLIGLACCLITFARATYVLFVTSWFPSARYAYPAIVPLLLGVMGGWFVLLNRSPSVRFRRVGSWTIAGLFATLNILSLINIAQFYAMQ